MSKDLLEGFSSYYFPAVFFFGIKNCVDRMLARCMLLIMMLNHSALDLRKILLFLFIKIEKLKKDEQHLNYVPAPLMI